MNKCDIIERECLKYAKALGGHTKVISTSIGELRKQQVLPVRHEMLSQHQEKLDHLYKAKIEQLQNLTNRVLSLSSTLGPEFFALDLTEPPPAYGESVSEAQPLREVTPERFSKLEKELARGKAEINRRLQQLSATFLQLDWLYQELDIPPPSCEDEDVFAASSSLKPPMTQRIPSISRESGDPFLSSVSSIGTPTPCPRGKSSGSLVMEPERTPDYNRIYTNFLVRVDEAESVGKSVESNPLIGLEGVQPTVELMAWAEETKNALEETKKRRETHIQAMYDQLEALWKRLGVEDEDIDGFVENNRGSTEAVVRSYEEELERMLELKRERMSVFIGNAREEIEVLWDELMYGEMERAEFAPFTDDEHSEDLLTTHEDEIRRLKEERRIKAPLLTSIRKYFEICDGEKELAAAAQDQSRLLGRGPRDPGRLLREEKMRKRVKREKPRLEQELLNSIPAWEEAEGRPFLVNGVRVMEVLESLGATAKESSRQTKTRAGSVPARSTTPQTGIKRSASRSASSDSESNPNKRARVVSTTSGQSKARAVSVKKEPQESRVPSSRVPFSSRIGTFNSNAGSSTQNGAPSTLKKGTRTPSVASVPRPASASSKAPIASTQRVTRGAGIGLGHPSSAQRGRPISASASATTGKTFSLMGTGRTPRGVGPAKRTPKRNNRKESFRPRPSTVGALPSRFGGPFEFTVPEEDGY
ncbi:uncharacterized protein FOMMEDRAFT_116908 [Fomitiporia mediterranea MF3/22]|uniref:uncharacterized protein n=1 Tax=Fomitiporia mediterranea (strain MF3/22) TaxID=694068 RepID=UPI00044076DC|nr:uncharacterized protein FOMMEDRAFT_116908 [Fomitiporia mediterranea MF3/22]EJD08479.1 hypothetical protein FOMMEDRAFT_116908 [Fomitiporia mediterranea MF3/22]